MPSTKTQKAAAARAWAAKSQKKPVECSDLAIESLEPEHANHNSEIECTGWNGGVNYVASDTDTDDKDWKDTDSDSGGAKSGEDLGEDDNKDLEGLEGEDLLDSLQNRWELLQQELKDLGRATPYEHILKKTTAKEWKKAETNCGLGYNGQLARWK
jgi:hypothetical protein